MNFLQLSVLSLGLLLSLGQCNVIKVKGETSKRTDAARCCTADQFETGYGAIIGQAIDGTPSASVESLRGGFDFKGRRYGMNVSVVQFDGTSTEYRFIRLFEKGKAYIILDGFCHQVPLGKEPVQCVPDSATYMDSFYLGDKALLVDSWYMDGKQSVGLEGALFATTTSGDCVPGSNTFVGTSPVAQGNKAYMTVSGGYMNFTLGIKDPDQWFVPPDSCGNSTNLLTESFRLPLQHWKRMQAMKMML